MDSADVSRFYQKLDRPGGLDYGIYNLPTIGFRTFRGPSIDTSAPYVVFVGSAHTFGRFVTDPFPGILGFRLGIPVLNLAVGGAGPRHFLTPEYLDLINGAEAAVIQILSGRSASNSQFNNFQHGGVMGRVRGDLTPTRAEDFLTRFAQSAGTARFEELVNETRFDYVSTFVQLLRKIVVAKILFWFSTRVPKYEENYKNIPNGVLAAFPHLVNHKMVERLALHADDYVECVSKQGIPHPLWPAVEPIDGAVLKNGTLENHHYPSPEMHVAAADALEKSCRRFTGRIVRAGPSPAASTPFVVVAAERTGTNLLIGLLNDFAGCYCGGELFNANNIKNDFLPWRDIPEAEREQFLALRKSDPVALWKTLCARAAGRGIRAVGFKFLYSQGLQRKELLECLAADKSIPVIHLTRRNLLRRYVSERQALASGRWAEPAGAAGPVAERPKVAFSMHDAISSVEMIEAQQSLYDSKFTEHPVLRLLYEDLARRPVRTAERVVEFLGLESQGHTPTVKYRKTGQEDLSDAVADYDVLRAKMRRWSAFFEE